MIYAIVGMVLVVAMVGGVTAGVKAKKTNKSTSVASARSDVTSHDLGDVSVTGVFRRLSIDKNSDPYSSALCVAFGR